jgi:enterochelin esterase family protein
VLAAVVVLVSVASCSGDTAGETTTTSPSTSTTGPALVTTTTAPEGIDFEPPATLPELEMLLNTLALARPDVAEPAASRLWDHLVSAARIPFVDGEGVVFLYRGDAEQVVWRGDFTQWDRGPGIEGVPVGDTGLWVGEAIVPRDARALYRIFVDGEGIADPGNPHLQVGGISTDSVLTMPGFTETSFADPVAGEPVGSLHEPEPFPSEVMGYDIVYRVYTPAGYDEMSDLPVLYVTDGSDFWRPEMGAMPIVLDRLIAQARIMPVMAVFVDAWDPTHTENRREVEFLERPLDYASFLADELVPLIDGTYRTDPSRERRVIVGTSYGGLGATYTGIVEGGTFGNAAMFSPAFWAMFPEAHTDPVRKATAAEMSAMVTEATTCGPGTDVACPPMRIFMTSGIPEWDVGDLQPTATELTRQGFDHRFIQVEEGHNWAQWSSLTDEMLEFFFPAG